MPFVTQPHVFPISDIHNWFFYNLGVTQLPSWYTESYNHEAILERIAQILQRQGRFNEYTRTQINLLWQEVDSLHDYVLALETRLDLEDQSLQSQITALSVRVDGIDTRVHNLEECEIQEGSLFDFLSQGTPGQIIVKDPAADNWMHTDWKDNPATSGVQSVTAGTNVTIDNTDPAHPIINSTGGGSGSSTLAANLTKNNVVPSIVATPVTGGNDLSLEMGPAGLIPVVDTTTDGTKYLETTISSGSMTVGWSNVAPGSSMPLVPGLGVTTIDNYLLPIDSALNQLMSNGGFNKTSQVAGISSLPATGNPNTIYFVKVGVFSVACIWEPGALGRTLYGKSWTGGGYIRISDTHEMIPSNIVDFSHPVYIPNKQMKITNPSVYQPQKHIYTVLAYSNYSHGAVQGGYQYVNVDLAAGDSNINCNELFKLNNTKIVSIDTGNATLVSGDDNQSPSISNGNFTASMYRELTSGTNVCKVGFNTDSIINTGAYSRTTIAFPINFMYNN